MWDEAGERPEMSDNFDGFFDEDTNILEVSNQAEETLEICNDIENISAYESMCAEAFDSQEQAR